MEYTIIVGSEILTLEKIVNEFAVLDGNQRGGMMFDPRTKLYCQPVVRKVENGAKEN